MIIDKALMDALGIESDTPLQVTVSGNSLIVTPVDVGVGREQVKEAPSKLCPRYAEMLQSSKKRRWPWRAAGWASGT